MPIASIAERDSLGIAGSDWSFFVVSPKRLDIEPDTMSLEEFAARLGISLTSAYEKAQRDVLPVPRVPGLGGYRFSRRAYDELMARQHADQGGRAA